MAERKTTIALLGHSINVTEVPVVKSAENYNEYTLEDGAVIRVKVPTNIVYRIDDQHDAAGNPIYIVINGTVVSVVSVPENLRKVQTH